MSEVLINPDQVVAKANELNSLAKKMTAKVDEVHGLAQSMSAVWQDTAQEHYESDFAKLSSGFTSFIESIPEFTSQAEAHAELMRAIGRNG